jgi:hypothetical protein
MAVGTTTPRADSTARGTVTAIIMPRVGDVPNRYTSDVVLNQQDRMAHRGGMADSLPSGPVAGSPWRYIVANLEASIG